MAPVVEYLYTCRAVGIVVSVIAFMCVSFGAVTFSAFSVTSVSLSRDVAAVMSGES